ncbi:biotin/lipoyl-containing protein [Roseovarius ramblicola]|uniref:Biotin/lipoyl-containing protein n=1 Tax=Roseovarius ramblicola TaxID=2022336 RepID=A0ABV5HUQ2_9RHOB
MPHDVTMPQLGMAQDAGKIVSWLKSPGDAVARGDALFEVETDKATMEVEAQADGFLTGVTASEGDDVPVGAVIARISDSAAGDTPAPAPAPAETPAETPAEDLPPGHSVTMPQLGMAQDTGLLVAWLKSPGDAVAAADILFEVETDKSTMEVEAGRDGYLAATLAKAGEEVPVGDAVAILSDEAPAHTVARSVATAPAQAAPTTDTATDTAPGAAPVPAAPGPRLGASPAAGAAAPHPTGGRILASPKARRLALEQGLDLTRLAGAGYPQPYHVRDLDTLRALPAATAPAPDAGAAASRHLVAEIAGDGVPGFAAWAAEAHGLSDADAILAGLAAACLATSGPVAVEQHGQSRTYALPADSALSGVAETGDSPALILRDLRGSRLRSVDAGGEATPVLTLLPNGAGLTITLDCTAGQLDAHAAIRLLDDFAGRVEQPLRHLL